MNRKRIGCVFAGLVLCFVTFQANATLISGQDIISAPAFVLDDPPGATNTHQQAFDEVQNYMLTTDLAVDGGFISAGTVVSSHMIFLNSLGTTQIQDFGVVWGFDSDILGVMSDVGGMLEAASSSFLGAIGTVYPSAFANRGMEGNDSYTVAGSFITVNMVVTEPGDWIRVLTVGVPESGSLLLLGLGLAGLGAVRRRTRV